jgi:hypothetical protein
MGITQSLHEKQRKTMTDKIKKLESLTEDVQPEFPTLSRGGYVEDTVDDWLSNHLREVNEIIKYQNYGVDVVDALEGELEVAHARIQELENAPAPTAVAAEVSNDSSAEVAALQAALAQATARIKELENTPIGEFPTEETETVQASILLQHATKLGTQYIEKAKADGEQIRKDAEDTLVELRGEIEELEAHRFATFRSLEDFYAQELLKLRENAVFAVETGNEPAVEAEVEPEAGLEAEIADEDVPAEEVVEDESPFVAEEVEEAEPTFDEENDDELETSEILDEDSEDDSK